MIMINYIKPHIVISADYLISGIIKIYSNKQIIKKIKVYNENAVNIKNEWPTYKTIKIEMQTQKENIHKTINL